MIDVDNITFDYQETPLIKNVSFSLPAGGLLHLRGANGTGKTTLIKLIAGLYQPANGEIRYLGKSIDKDLKMYQRSLCFIGHKSGINPYLSLKENCIFDIHYGAHKERINQLASLFKLEHSLDIPCGLLSAGQQRKAGLIRLWMTDAALWLLDEPLVALDDVAINLVMAKIAEHQKKGGAVLLTSHQSLPLNNTDYEEYFL